MTLLRLLLLQQLLQTVIGLSWVSRQSQGLVVGKLLVGEESGRSTGDTHGDEQWGQFKWDGDTTGLLLLWVVSTTLLIVEVMALRSREPLHGILGTTPNPHNKQEHILQR
jgi:hypothetical protein